MTNCSFLIQSPELICVEKMIGKYRLSGSPTHAQNLDCAEICFVKDGQGEAVLSKKNYPVQKGDFIVCNPFIVYEDIFPVGNQLQLFFILIKNVHIIGKQKGHLIGPNESPVIRLYEKFDLINSIFECVLNEYQEKKFGYNEIISSLLQTLIALLLRYNNSEINTQLSSISHQIKNYIESNYNKDLSLTELSNLVFVSPYHLAHIFKQEVSVSPIQYLINCRINEAKKLLKYSNQSVSEIASSVGYPNSNYFNLLFTKMVGKNPGKYKKNPSEEI